MYITENQNLGDSVLFLLAARTALSNIVQESSLKNKQDMVSFLNNEASDYQVMNLLLKGSLPEEKYNAFEEMMLYSEFKESMMINKDFVTEITGEDIFDNVLNEVDSLYMVTSTESPILEFEMQTDDEMAKAVTLYSLSEAASKPILNKALKTAKDYWTKGDGGKAVGKTLKTAKDYWTKGDGTKVIAKGKKSLKTAKDYYEPKVKGKLASMKAARAKLAADKGLRKMATADPAKLKSAAASTSQAHAQKAAASAAQQKAAGAKLAQAAKSTTAKASTYKPTLAHKAQLAAGKAGAAIKGAAAKAGAATSKFAATKAGMATGGAAAAALAIYAGYKIYKRFFSQAAKACGGQSGSAKTACMNKYKKQALMKQVAGIQSAAGACSKSKDPAKCKAAIATKVSALKAKASKIAA
jgi:hypothetical protein